jgi:type IV fimbrial biogenesis protein FimT
MRTKRAVRGITLIETATASTIAAIAVGTAIPSFSDTLMRRAVDGTAAQLATDLQYVRSEAVARNRPLRIGFEQHGGASCYVIHSGAAGDCRCSADGATVCEPQAREFRTVQLPAQGRVQVTSNAPSMLFHPVRGTTTPAGTLRVVGANGVEVRHVVNMLGRARSCSPERSMPGYAAC